MVVGRFYPYATDSRERASLPVWFAVVAIALAYALHNVVQRFYPDLPWYVDLWSPIAIYGILFDVFSKHAWRWALWRGLAIVQIPDLNGKYSGTLSSSYGKHAEDEPCEFDIYQTWTTISIRGKFDKSWSYNMVTGISVADCAVPRLTYEYYNCPVEGAPGTMHPHPGTMWFDVHVGPSLRLDGDYYTGRGRKTTGTVRLVRASTRH